MVVSPIFGKPALNSPDVDVFVVMPFAESLDPVYRDHIVPVVRSVGASIARADDFFTAREVITDIWGAIAQATLIVADCTGRNPNVFYEIGLAHAIGRPVILLVQDEKDIPFDLRHLRYIRYEYTPRGMKRFEAELQSAVRPYVGRVELEAPRKGDVQQRVALSGARLQQAIEASKRKRIERTLLTIVDDEGIPTEERVKALIALMLSKDVTDIKSESSIIEQGADEVDMMELLVSIEKIFNIRITKPDFGALFLTTARDLAV